MKTKLIVLIIILVAIFNMFYTLDEREQAIITQFGNPIGGPIKNAGLHFKTPFIQKVHKFDKRILEWDGQKKQIPTLDKRYIWIDTFSRWRIIDPLVYYQTVRNETFAQSRLDDIISGTTRDVISSNPLIEIVRNTNREMKFSSDFQQAQETDEFVKVIKTGRAKIAHQIYLMARDKVKDYGIELIDVKIKRVNYVQEVRDKVYERMISERNKIAAKYRSEGEGKAAEILGKMQKELQIIQSDAYKQAETIKGKADADAIKIYANAYNRDPNFFEFLKTMETYETTIKDKNVIIMSTDSDFYKYLKKAK